MTNYATAIRAALEQHLAAMTPPLSTAYANEDYDPPLHDTPYQRVSVLFGQPGGGENGSSFVAQGAMMVRLLYPPKAGWGAALERAAAVQAHFRRGQAVLGDGLVVTISLTPEIGREDIDDGRFSLPLTIWFHTHISA